MDRRLKILSHFELNVFALFVIYLEYNCFACIETLFPSFEEVHRGQCDCANKSCYRQRERFLRVEHLVFASDSSTEQLFYE